MFIQVFFAVILIVAIIGLANILNFIFKILLIGISLIIIVFIFTRKHRKKTNLERISRQNEYSDKYFNKNKYFEDGTSQRPPVTGDYFCQKYDIYATNYYYCQYANTSNCLNCSRRTEHKINDKYYYGVSDNCKEFNDSDY